MVLYIVIFLISILFTYIIREFAIKKSIIDIPNDRSSHTVPTPRGGGFGIVVIFYFGISFFYYKDNISQELFFALLCSLPIVIVSLIDDIITLSSKIRFFIQIISSILAIYFLGGVNYIDFVIFELSGWWINVIVFFAIIWITNLYNFLDGIDGYAGSQAVIVGVGVFLILGNIIGILIAVATLGFLVFNWPKASIFMGDVGSATLGFIFAILCFYDTSSGNIYVWLILLSIFWFDATVTLFRRFRNRERITEAHKKHAYQRLSQSGWSHSKITISSIIINLFFLLGLFFTKEEYFFYYFLIIIGILIIVINFIDRRKAF